jgi:glycosyltransferase involved in cell wall biosynthesis
MVADGKNGFVVDSRDENVFAERMLSALALDRKGVSEYDKRFSYLAVSNLKEDLLKALKDN